MYPRYVLDRNHFNNFKEENELSSLIAANFCPTFFGLDFSFLCYFLLIGIGQLDNEVYKSAHPKCSIHSASKRVPLNLNANYVTVMKHTCTYQIS